MNDVNHGKGQKTSAVGPVLLVLALSIILITAIIWGAGAVMQDEDAQDYATYSE